MNPIRKTCIALLVMMISLPVCAYAQITVSAHDTPIRSVIRQIERTSEYRFFYNASLSDIDRKVNIELSDVPVGTALARLFAGTAIDYSVAGYQVTLIEKRETTAAKGLTGVVTNDRGERLVGVSVIVKGSNKAAATDMEGRFRFKDPLTNATLIVRYIGYATQEIKVGGRTSLNIVMHEESTELENVVVIGYGTLEKRELTSSVTSLKSSDMIAGNASSPLQSITGKVPGLSIISTAGTDPNSSFDINLRGVNSVKAVSDPLIVVDGIPAGNMNMLQKEDIVSIDILKDGSAAAIYGTRATGGVILVTTRMGREGKPSVSYTSELTTETVRRKAEVLTAEEWVAYGQTDRGGNTDWFNAITRTPFTHRQMITMTGGTKSFAAYASLFYKKAQGLTIDSDKREVGGRFNFNYTTLNDRLELIGRINYVDSKANVVPSSIFRDALNVNPTIPIYDPDDPSGYTLLLGEGEWNPLSVIKLRRNVRDVTRFQADFSARLQIMDGLSSTVTLSNNTTLYNYAYWESALHRRSYEEQRNGYAEQTWGRNNIRAIEWIFSYNKYFGPHSIKAVAGYSYQKWPGDEYFTGSNANFSVDGNQWYNMGEGTWVKEARSTIGSGKGTLETLAAYFGRVNYNYADRYFLSVSGRYEGSSRFGKNNQYGWFPAISAAWRVSNESFMRDAHWIDDLRLRVGYGRTGNQNFSATIKTRMYKPDTSSGVVRQWYYNGQWGSVWGLARNANEDIKWEVKDEYNIGFDISMFNNRLGVKFDVYKRKVTDLIYEINVAQPPSVYNVTTMNVGSLENNGYELELSGVPVRTRDWNYTTTLGLSHNKTTLVTLWDSQTTYDTHSFPTPGSPGTAVRLSPGEDIGQFFIWKYAGIADDGSWLLYDKDNNVIPATDKTLEDKRYIGNAIPKLILSWDNSVTWRNFSLSMFFRSWIKYDVFNMTEMYHGVQSASGQNVRNRLRTAFEKNANIKSTVELCDYFIEDGTFLKLDALTLGYTFDIPAIKDYVKNVHVEFTARNVFCLTKYTGIDPEVNINGLEPGFESLQVWPVTRVFTLGATINF